MLRVDDGANGKTDLLNGASPNRKTRRTTAATKRKRKGATTLAIAPAGGSYKDLIKSVSVDDLVTIIANALNQVLEEKGAFDAARERHEMSARQHKAEVYRLGCIVGGIERLAHKIGGPALLDAAHTKAKAERQDDATE